MSFSEELESKIDIVDLVSKYTKLKKSGTNYKAICPFPGHNEKSPSFMVSPQKQLAYCFGCHKGGGAIKFIMDIENCEFKNALEILGSITGIKINTDFNKDDYEEKKSLYSLYKDAVKYYKESLKKYSEVKKYLLDRGVNDNMLEKFNFGYSDSGIELYNYLKNKGYSDEIINDSMIFLDLKTRKDKFINRIIFPIQNQRGDFVALAGRIIGAGEPKYLNSPASNIYDKSSILYGLFNARNSITKNDFVIITEGYMDTISLQESGFLNTVAVSGTALTEKHLVILKRLTNKIYLCFDNDNAGENATKLAIELISNKGFEVKIILLNGGKDPDEIIKKGINFQDFIENAVSPVGYYIKNSKFDINSLDDKKQLLIKLIELVKSYSSDIEKDFYLKEISKLLNLNEKLIYDEFNKSRNSVQKNYTPNKTPLISSEEMAIGYILLGNENLKILEDKLLFKDFLIQDLKKAISNPNGFLQEIDLEKKEKYRGISLEIEELGRLKTDENIKETLEKLAKNINSLLYKKIIANLKEKIKSGDMEAFKKYSEITKIAKGKID